MKTAFVENEIDRVGVGQEASFTIKANAKAFKILSDGLYSDKITAIIRELSCNAYDAHVAAGCPEKPFFIQLPDRMNPEFIIRDYGTGLSDEDVMELYTTYFGSNKTHSNDFIGCLGLGSKSPFSYTDTFTVTVFLDGSKQIYTSYMDEHGCPSIAKMGERTRTTKPNGIEIRFGVNGNDHYEFANKARNVFRAFKVVPEIKSDRDIKIEPIKYITEGEGWGLRTQDSGISGAYAIMGNVRYPMTKLNTDLNNEQESLLRQNIDIVFEIGKVEPAASREELSYDASTIANIKIRLDEIFEEMSKIISEEFEGCNNAWEVKCKASFVINDKFASISKFMSGHDIIKYDGSKVSLKPIHVVQADPDLQGINIVEFHKNDRGYYRRSRKSTITFDKTNVIMPSNKSAIYIKDKPRGSQIRAKSLVNDEKFKRVYLVEVENDKQKEKLVNALGMEGMTLPNISEVPSPTSVKDADGNADNNSTVYGPSAKAKTKILMMDSENGYNDHRSNWEIAEVDMDEGGYYVPISRYKIVSDKLMNDRMSVADFIKIMGYAKKLGVDLDDIEIVGAKPVVLDKFVNDDNWIDLVDYMRDEIITKLGEITPYTFTSSKIADAVDYKEEAIINHIAKGTKLRHIIEGTLFGDFITMYKDGKSNSGVISIATAALREFCAVKTLDDYVAKADPAICNQTVTSKELHNRYPLFEHIDVCTWNDNDLKKASTALVDYIILIETMDANQNSNVNVNVNVASNVA